MTIRGVRRIAACAALVMTVRPAPAADNPEVEPNETRATATPLAAPLAPGDTLSGSSSGALPTPGDASFDLFLVRTAAAPPAVYRHRLTRSSAAAHGATLRGLTQSNGVIGTTDIPVQTAGGAPPFVQWYGFGRGEQLYFRVTGASTATAPYSWTCSTTAVTPQALGSFAAGEIVITTVGQGHATDTDLWVYDGAFNALPGFGNDDESLAGGGTGATTQSRLRRSYAPGTYFLALTSFNLANDQPSPADDDFDDGNVLDFSDALLTSSSAANVPCTFTITDSAGASLQVPATRPGPFDVLWFTFNVPPPPPAGACCFADGACAAGQTPDACAAAGGAYGGDGSGCAPNACPQPGACCYADGGCILSQPVACLDTGGEFRGGGVPCAASACLGGCCLADGACADARSAAACAAAGGTFRGHGTTCGPPNPCPPPGACCLADGGCLLLSAAACAAVPGAYFGDGSSCELVVCTGACCRPDGACVTAAPDECAAAGGTFRGIGSDCALPCGCFGEHEPNDSKALATVSPLLADGDCIQGVSTGGSGPEVDYFQVRVAPRPAGLYRHRLEYLSDTPGHGAAIRGLAQLDGVPAPGSDAIVQTALATTTPPRFVQWYGFGRGESFYLRVTGAATTAAPYLLVLSSTPVPPVSLGDYAAGAIVITTVGQGHANDTDLWVYDAEFVALPGCGNDDESAAGGGSGTTLQSRLAREYAPGRYFLALSQSNLANDLGSPADDDFRIAPVLDFPDLLVGGGPAPNLNVSFAIRDAAGALNAVSATRSGPFDVLWFEFTVGGPPCPGPRGDANCDGGVDFFDIDPFLLALFDLPAYQAMYCGGIPCAADVNCSSGVDFFDIDPFLNCLFDDCLPRPPMCP